MLTEVISQIMLKSTDILKSWNLAVNTVKTEKTTLRQEDKKEKKTWRKVKKLGSALGDNENMRKQLAIIAFKSLIHIWKGKVNKK